MNENYYECAFWVKNRFMIDKSEIDKVEIRLLKRDCSNAAHEYVRILGEYCDDVDREVINQFFLGSDNGCAENHISIYYYVAALSKKDAKQKAVKFAENYGKTKNIKDAPLLKKRTNFEIITESPEGLAKIITDLGEEKIMTCFFCGYDMRKCMVEPNDCYNNVLKWLKQPQSDAEIARQCADAMEDAAKAAINAEIEEKCEK